MNVEEFDSLIQNEDIQRLDVRTLAEYSEGHITKTININVIVTDDVIESPQSIVIPEAANREISATVVLKRLLEGLK